MSVFIYAIVLILFALLAMGIGLLVLVCGLLPRQLADMTATWKSTATKADLSPINE